MSSHMQRQLQQLADPANLELLTRIRRGIEKESLRITPDGTLAQTPHPPGLGSPLAHSAITTDYSEALLEFITPVSLSIEDSLEMLEDIHSFVYTELGDELLWAASMPCIMGGDSSIPVARYGSSNVAQMKTIYRYGLGHRYGRLMQTIAGIHYNFSMPQAWWEKTHAADAGTETLDDYISRRYLDLIRNFNRYSWLLIYLYGASPAVCASFLRGRQNHGLEAFDEQSNSLHLPYATALRMGDLGYQSNAQKNLNICYNSLENYIDTLRQAIQETHPAYHEIGVGGPGNYRQLSDGLLQIENEFYSPIRPKRITQSGETPLRALHRDGIEYIEVRCIDVCPFSAVGIDAAQIRFLDTFLLFCLLKDSPACNEDEQALMHSNLETVVNRGRQPKLMLRDDGGERPFREMAATILSGMNEIANLLDTAHDSVDYSAALNAQRAKIDDPGLTPSARVLGEMADNNLPFYRLAMNYSEQWARYFRDRVLPPQRLREFQEHSRKSLAAQARIEAEDDCSFEDYLARYYRQYQEL